MEMQKIRLHHTMPNSLVNGPGTRFVIWTQGCSFNCPGCFNPDTFSPSGGREETVENLSGQILECQDRIEGITISGGEPLIQREALRQVLSLVHQTASLGVILFTGYTWVELQHLPQIKALLNEIDLVIAGRFQLSNRLGASLMGSSNKTQHYLTSRYRASDLDVPPAEVVISADGEIHLSGIDPLSW